jgi:hypothetical protein
MDAYPLNSLSHPTDEMEMVIDAQARKPSVAGTVDKPVIMERVWGHAARVDPTVTYEEYVYWAKIEREIEAEEEKKFRAEHGKYPLIDLIKGKLSSEGRTRMKKEKAERAMALQSSIESNPSPLTSEKKADRELNYASPTSDHVDPLKATDAEWRIAARAMRTASWGQMFFLITTDILGWSGAP